MGQSFNTHHAVVLIALAGWYKFYFRNRTTLTSSDAKQEQAHAFGKRVWVVSGRGRVQKGPPRAGLTVNPPILAIKRKHDNNDYHA